MSYSSVTMWQKRCADARFLLSVVTILAMLAPDIAFAENRYWRGGSANLSWSDIYNWANNESAAPTGASVPGAGDIAIFTKTAGLSGTSSGSKIILREAVDIAALILSPTFSGRILTGTSSVLIGSRSGGLRIGSGRLQIGTGTVFSCSGSITMTGGILSNSSRTNRMRLSGSLLHQGGTLSYSGTILFNDNNADQTLRITDNPTVSQTYKYAKATLSGVTLNNTAGTTIDDLLISGATLFLRSVTVTLGNLDLARYNVGLSISGSMVIASNAQAGFNASTQTLTLSGSIQKGASGYIYNSGGTLVMNGDQNQTLDFGGYAIHNLTINSVGSASNDNIIIANGSQLLLSGALTITNGNLNLMDNTEVMVVERGITITSDADAQLTTNSNIFASGAISVGANAVLAITGGTLTLNDKGNQTLDLAGKRIYSLEVNNLGPAADDSVIVSNGSQLLLSGALTVTNGTLNLMDFSEPMIVRRDVTLANDADAIVASNANIIASGSISTGASASWTITGATVILNGNTRRQAIDFDNTKMVALTVTNTSSGVLTSNATVLGAVTINTGSLLAFGANSLYATGSSIVNYGNIKEDTGKLSHTGSNFVVGNSSYARQQLFYNGDTVYFTLTDKDENIVGSAADTLTITVTLKSGGTTRDTETVTLTETMKESGIFRGSVTTKNQTASSENGYLDYTADADISALYTDAQDALTNSDGGIFQVTGGSSTAAGGGSGGGGGGGRRVGASAPVQGPKKTPPPVRRELKETVKKPAVKKATGDHKAWHKEQNALHLRWHQEHRKMTAQVKLDHQKFHQDMVERHKEFHRHARGK